MRRRSTRLRMQVWILQRLPPDRAACRLREVAFAAGATLLGVLAILCLPIRPEALPRGAARCCGSPGGYGGQR